MPTRQAKRYDRVASCSRWISRDDVEDGLVRAPRHLEGLEGALGAAAPDFNRQ